jgi:hypothetical protein
VHIKKGAGFRLCPFPIFFFFEVLTTLNTDNKIIAK